MMDSLCLVDAEAVSQKLLRIEADINRHSINVHRNTLTPLFSSSSSSNNVNYKDIICKDCEDEEDYTMKIKELQAYLDTVKQIVKPGCSEQVLKVALMSMSSLVNILTLLSSTSKLHASL